jgi:tRNA(Ile)-lysidine synthase
MGKMGDIIGKTRSTIARYGMAMPGDRVIVAVSGGPDSVCLLDVLNRLSQELEINLVAAHYDHGLRQDEDEIEAQLVKDIAASMCIPFEFEKAPAMLKDSPSLEERARDARYAFLEKIRSKYGAQKIAMGHNLNDQAETVIIRLLRGSGPSGLAGIPPVRDNIIIRPLIETARDEIINYLKAKRIPFATDSSNTDKKHLRNRIRLELMPMLLEYQPRLFEHLGTISNIIRDEDEFLESMASEWIKSESIKAGHGDISAAVSSVKNLPAPLKNRVIRNLLKQVDGNVYPMEYDHVLSVLNLLDNEQPQCSIDLPNGITVKKIYNRLNFYSKSEEQHTEYSYLIKGTGTHRLGTSGQTLILEELESYPDIHTAGEKATAYLDADKVQFPLIARNFRPGDRFVPLGMKGHKKLKNFFIDLKVPSKKRALTPILTSGDKVVWVCGYRIDERFKVTAGTKRVLRVRLSQLEG